MVVCLCNIIIIIHNVMVFPHVHLHIHVHVHVQVGPCTTCTIYMTLYNKYTYIEESHVLVITLELVIQFKLVLES